MDLVKGQYLVSVVSGAIFAVGLAIGGMLEPVRVVGFLDFFGTWDPTLAFVMGGGLGVNIFAYHVLTKKRDAPSLATRFHLPTRADITPCLVVGSAIFGVGWALAGFCPGPAVVTMATGTLDAFAFVAAMAAGMYVWSFIDHRVAPQAAVEKPR
jgi:uncharacterized membrane protein YedE/YeeE